MTSVWEEIKAKLTLDEVIAEYVPIVRKGSNLACNCPFHKEKTPSLMISPEKGIWHCFGCGAGGDMFAFVTEIEHITKQEALEKLAKKAHVELARYKPEHAQATAQEVSHFEQGQKLLEWSADVYHKMLKKILQDVQHPITQYCRKRNLSAEIIDQFKIGYAPKNSIISSLIAKYNLSVPLLQEVGLLKETINNQIKDKFTDRLMIPVTNHHNLVVGFTGRVLPYDTSERPKYLNSAQSQWFNKSELWFGYALAKKHIIQHKKALLVEGNMDVIASFQKGLYFTIASQGTSFTPTQLDILKKITQTIWLAFDNDNAGKIAGHKLFLESAQKGFTVKKVVIPEQYKDLDEYVQQLPDGSDIEQQLEVMDYLDYYLLERQHLLRSSVLEEQKSAINEVIQSLSVTDLVTREHYLKKLSTASGVSINTLESLIKNAPAPVNYTQKTKPEPTSTDQLLEMHNAFLVNFQQCLALLVSQSKLTENSILVNNLLHVSKEFVSELHQYTSVEEYAAKNADMLDFIVKNEIDEQGASYPMIWKRLMYVLDREMSKLILSEDLKQMYFVLKTTELV